MCYEIRDRGTLIASSTDETTALALAREWLREGQQIATGTHTCIVQARDGEQLLGERIVALSAGPLVG